MPTRPSYHHQRLAVPRGGPALREREHRPHANTRGYDRRWQAFRRAWLGAHPLCALCGNAAVLVDHVTPISAGGAILDPTNVRSLCRACHDEVTANYKATGCNEPRTRAKGFAGEGPL